jgi:hypothetical protein
MGTVINFSKGQWGVRVRGDGCGNKEPASVIILPVVRIERHSDEPADGFEGASSATPGGRRRRRASRL